MRDPAALDFDTQLLRAAMTKLEDLGEPFTDEERELRAECNALMGRLTRLRNRLDEGEADLVRARVDAVHEAATRCVTARRLRVLPYSPVDPTEGSGAPGAA